MWVKEESTKNGLKLNMKKTKIMATGPITSWEIEREDMEAVTYFTFLGSIITADHDSSHKEMPASWEKSDDNPRQHLKKQRHHLADKGPHSQSYVFSSSNVWK